MTQLYHGLWINQEGDMLVDGMYSDNFLLWCRKTEILSNDEFAVGFNELERQKIASAANAKKIFPPDYATFIGMCKAKKHRIDPINDPSHPNYIAPKLAVGLHKRDRIGSPEQMEKEKKLGNDAIKGMLEGL